MTLRLATVNRLLAAFGLVLVVAVSESTESGWTEFRLMTRNNWLRAFQ